MSFQNDITGIPAPLPADYDRQTNFTDWQLQNPGTTTPGTLLDIEFNAVEQALDQTQARLSLIQNDDGSVLNQAIGLDQLKTEALIGVNAPEDWAAFTAYAASDTVIISGEWYINLTSHTSSGVFADDLANGYWRSLINLTPYTVEAKNWANYATDAFVPEGDGTTEYSARHHAAKALASQIAAAISEGTATTQAGNASTSATAAQLSQWIAQAKKLTAESYATQTEDVYVNTYASDGDGTFTATATTEYSALHWAAKSDARATAAGNSEIAAGNSETAAQLIRWIAEAKRLTAESYATQTEDVFVNTYTSDGDGTFTATPTTDYSALHWAAKSDADAVSTANDLVATNQDTLDTAADKVQTGLDRAATNNDVILAEADKVQTGLDRIAAANSANTSTDAATATQTDLANAGSMLGINFGSFTLVDGELTVAHLTTSTPSLVDGELILTYEGL